MKRERNTDQAARTCERFVYSVVKITRFYDYQTWQTHFLKSSQGGQIGVGFFFLIVLFGCWLAGQANLFANLVELLICINSNLSFFVPPGHSIPACLAFTKG